MKKSFVLHIDSLDILQELTTEQKGELLQAMLDYQLGKELGLSGLMKAIFLPFKNQFIRDNEKYASTCEKNKCNGANGGRPKKPTKTHNNPMGYYETQHNPQKPDSDSDSDNDSDSKKESVSDNNNIPPPPEMILDLYIEQDLLSCAKGYFLHTNFQHAIELLLMNHNIKEKSVNELKHTALEFNKHCALEGKIKRSLTEWGKHFKNWLTDPKRISAVQYQAEIKVEKKTIVHKSAEQILAERRAQHG